MIEGEGASDDPELPIMKLEVWMSNEDPVAQDMAEVARELVSTKLRGEGPDRLDERLQAARRPNGAGLRFPWTAAQTALIGSLVMVAAEALNDPGEDPVVVRANALEFMQDLERRGITF